MTSNTKTDGPEGRSASPQINLIRTNKAKREKPGLDFEGVRIENLEAELPGLKTSLLEQIIVIQLNQYFEKLEGAQPHPLYDLVMQAAERPLLVYAMKLCRNNQVDAAKILGINRNTLRTKLRFHQLVGAEDS